jgi:nitroreductase
MSEMGIFETMYSARAIRRLNAPPAHMNAAQYERFLKSCAYLYEHMAEAPVLIVPCLRLRPPNLPTSLPEEVRNRITREFPWALAASIYPAVQNIIVACRGLGLGTVLTTNHMLLEDEMKQALGLGTDVKTFGLMPIGYPDSNFGPVVRKPIGEVAFRDRVPRRWGD